MGRKKIKIKIESTPKSPIILPQGSQSDFVIEFTETVIEFTEILSLPKLLLSLPKLLLSLPKLLLSLPKYTKDTKH